MKRLQDNLDYYNRQYESILNSRDSYTRVRSNEYGPWQPNTWQVSGAEILGTKGLYWWYGIPWKKGRCGQHMKNDTATRQCVKDFICCKKRD